jgi:hypothetical protein
MFSEDSPLPVGGAGAGAGAHDDAAASPPPSPAAVPASASPEKFSTPKSNDRGDERVGVFSSARAPALAARLRVLTAVWW